MSHPNVEELSDFLYDELSPARQADVARHVEACAECRARVEVWRGVRARLAAWELPPTSTRAAAASRVSGSRQTLRWAVAAAVLLGAGFGLARMTEEPVDLSGLRADLAREVRQEAREELAVELTNHAEKQATWQQEFQSAVVEAMSQLETRQVVNHASLRKDVETVALHAQEEFDRLASSSQGATGVLPLAE